MARREAHGRYRVKWPGPEVVEELEDGGLAVYSLRPCGWHVSVASVSVVRPEGVGRRHLRALRPEAAITAFYRVISLEVSLRELVSALRAEGQPEEEWRPFLELVEGSAIAWAKWQPVLDKWRSDPLDGRSNVIRLALVAALYVQALDRGSRAPNEEVVLQMGRSLSQIREDLRAARRKGLLDPRYPGKGQAAGRLTERARAILDGEESE